MSSLVAKIRAPTPVIEPLPGQQTDEEKKADPDAPPNYDQQTPSDSESIDSDLQHGIQAAQATASVWPKSHLILAYIMFVAPSTCLSAQEADITVLIIHCVESGSLASSIQCNKA